MNEVILLGRMVADAETKSVGNEGNKVTNFTIAVDRKGKDAGTDFIRCVAWNKTGEIISQYIKKGRQIAIKGALQTGSYKTQKDGVEFTQYSADVRVEEFDFVGDSNKNSSNATATTNTGAATANSHETPYIPSVNNLESLDSMDSIPSLF